MDEDASSNETHAVSQPRLGIVHLLAWMLTSGLMLACMRSLPATSDQAGTAHQTLFIAWEVAMAFCSGAGLGGVLLWGFRQWRGGPAFPVAPGHWLLLILGWRTVLDWLSYAGVLVWHRSVYEAWPGATLPLLMILIVQVPQYLAMTLLWMAATTAVASHRSSLWQDSMALLMTQELVCLVVAFLCFGGALVALLIDRQLSNGDFIPIWFWLINRASLLVFGSVAVLLAVWVDVARHQRRDWLQWTGVVVCLTSTALAWLWVWLQ